MEIGRAKPEILSILTVCGAISEKENYAEGLLLRSREVLARALMYLPMKQLKSSMISLLKKLGERTGPIPSRLWDFLFSDSEEMCY